MLRAMGARLEQDGNAIAIQGPADTLQPLSMRIPGDFSSAAFWLVLACIHPDARLTVRGVGLNPTRTGLLEVLRSIGARVVVENERVEGGEPVADITAESSALEPFDIGGEIIPRLLDEVPVLALAAAFAGGESRIRDAAELRVKESDRLASTAAELSRLGVEVEEQPDGLVIGGGRRLQEAQTSSHDDHRLAMTLAVAGAAGAGVQIADPQVASVSYPSFWQDLADIGAGVEPS
jgi:3-phosphoshikimate 1-carboxyvinyltransferase